ncbi:hypothetical protein HGRIS_000160 [Hohenbuehelia grisea]|uniref:Uncharacterized protein n=1 Tax=Hohenbuehelia grisea TaxID=104357 RepID=A0ABR3JRT0_9AGAR
MDTSQPPAKKSSADILDEKGKVKPAAEKPPQRRPSLAPTAAPSMDTKYVNMLLAQDGIPLLHNIATSFFTWILLAGFVLFPGTFSKVREVDVDDSGSDGLSLVKAHLLRSVQHMSIFVIAWVCCGIGAFGMLFMWIRWRSNYIWIVNRIFLPGLLNSTTGVLSTLVNVYGSQDGKFTATSKMTLIVTGAAATINGILVFAYTTFGLGWVRWRHARQVGKEVVQMHNEGIVDRNKRKPSMRSAV